uniref:Ig-like domain-containing protein n=1 Tax=Trichobilharzia regenti TaxID=157069 RepID=A0AA85J1H5_TRIRE|nr:unnamed protein product [Trichobilharzia regenti]
MYTLQSYWSFRSWKCPFDCEKGMKLEVYFEDVHQHEISYKKAHVNKSIPVTVKYMVFTEKKEIDPDTITWKHNDVVMNIGDSDNQDVYYKYDKNAVGYVFSLHLKMPTARVTGTWTLTVNTKDGSPHSGNCQITSQPIIRSRFSAVRGHEGNPLSVLCEIDGFPAANQVSWKRLVEKKDGSSAQLLPVTNAVFKAHGTTRDAIMEWSDASDSTGFYLCTATSRLGSDSQLLEVRIKSKLAPLWPFIGIIAEILVLGIIILIYERAQAKRRREEERATLLKPNPESDRC